jgi:hypothetical protein
MSPPLYVSTTHEARLEGLPPTLLAAVRAHAERASLGLEGARVWCTHRENPPQTSFLGKLFGRRSNPADPDAEHDMVLVLTATHLVVATGGPTREATVMSVPLLGATATRGLVMAAALGHLDTPGDDGISIGGFPGTEGRPGTYFFGMGGPEADTCFGAVRDALAAAKR